MATAPAVRPLRLIDALPPEAQDYVARTTMDQRVGKLLSLDVSGMRPEERAAAVQAVTQALPRMNFGAASIREANRAAATREAQIPATAAASRVAEYRAMDPGRRALAQGAQGFMNAMPSLEKPLQSVPAPTGRAETLARAGGGVVGFGAAAVPIALTGGAAGLAPAVSGALAGGIPAAEQYGETGGVGERLKRGAVWGAAGGIQGAAAAGTAARTLAAPGISQKVGIAAAGVVKQAAIGGVAAPAAEGALSGHMPAAQDYVQAFGMNAILASLGVHEQLRGAAPERAGAAGAVGAGTPPRAMLGAGEARTPVEAEYTVLPTGAQTGYPVQPAGLIGRGAPGRPLPANTADLQANFETGPAPNTAQETLAQQTTAGLVDAFARRAASGLPVRLADGSAVTPIDIRFYPWAPQQVRINAIDHMSGAVIPLRFRDLAEMNGAITSDMGPERTPAPGTRASFEATPEVVAAAKEGSAARTAAQAALPGRADALRRQIAERPGDSRVGAWKRRLAKIEGEAAGSVQATAAAQEPAGPGTSAVAAPIPPSPARTLAAPQRTSGGRAEQPPPPATVAEARRPRGTLPNMQFDMELVAQRVASRLPADAGATVVRTKKGYEIEVNTDTGEPVTKKQDFRPSSPAAGLRGPVPGVGAKRGPEAKPLAPEAPARPPTAASGVAAKAAPFVEGLPEPAPGHVRLYRGEAIPGRGKGLPSWMGSSPEVAEIQRAEGRWYTPSLKDARDFYAADAPNGGRVLYIDIPADQIGRLSASNDAGAKRFSRRPEEVFLPERPKVLEQATMPVASAAVPEKPIAVSPEARASSERALAGMAGEARTFEQHFRDRILAGDDHAAAAKEAEALAGAPPPAGLDLERRAGSIRAEAARERGQNDMFGGATFLGEPERARTAASTAPETRPSPPDVSGGGKREKVVLPLSQGSTEAGPEAVQRMPRGLHEGHAAEVRRTERGAAQEGVSQVPRADLREAQGAPETALSALRHEGAGGEAPPGLSSAARGGSPVSSVSPEGAHGSGVGRPPESKTMRAQSIHTDSRFQNKKTGTHLVNDEYVQTLLERHGGFNRDELAKNPITVWTDEHGALGAAGRTYVLGGHHRHYLAQHTWERQEGRWVATGSSDRDLPVVEVHGSLEHATEQARLSNLEQIGNTYSEKAALARQLHDEGAGFAEIGNRLEGVSERRAEAMHDFAHLAEAVRETYYPNGREDSVLGGARHGEVVGRMARRAPELFTPEVQRGFLKAALDDNLSPVELADQIRGWHEVLTAARQEGLGLEAGPHRVVMTPREFVDTAGRLTRAVSKAKAVARADRKAFKGLAERSVARGDETASKVAQAALREADAEVARLEKFEGEIRGKTLAAVREAAAGKVRLEEALGAIRKEIERAEGPEYPAAAAPGLMSMTGPEGMLYWLLRPAFTRAWRAAETATRALGREQTRVKVQNEAGDVVRSEPLAEWHYDPMAEFASARLMGRFAGGGNILPDPIRTAFDRGYGLREHLHKSTFEAVHRVLGDEGMYAVREGSPAGRQMFLAGEGSAHTAPQWLAEKLPAIRAVLDQMFAAEAAEAKRLGREPPRYRENYMTHVTVGDRPTLWDEFAKFTHGREPTREEVQQVADRFLEQRSANPNYERDFMVALTARINAFARFMAFAEPMDMVMRYVDGAQPADLRRAASVRDWAIAAVMDRKGSLELSADHRLRAAFMREKPGIVRITEKAALQHVPGARAAIRAGKLDRFYLAEKGARIVYTAKRYERLGETADGRSVLLGGSDGYVMDVGAAQFRAPVAKLLDAYDALAMRLTGKAGNAEERIIREFQSRRRAQAFARDPARRALGRLSSLQSRSLLGWNARAAIGNLGSIWTHTLPEVGVMPWLAGLRGAGRAAKATMLRNVVDWQERTHLISGAEAETRRAAIPHVVDELLAEGLGSQVGGIAHFDAEMRRIERGWQDTEAKALEIATSMGPFGAVEALTRGVDAAAFYARGVSLGLEPGAIADLMQQSGASRDAQLRAIFGDMKNPRSAAYYAAHGPHLTVFPYDARGFAPWQMNPVGRFFTTMTQWWKQTLVHQELRPVEGFFRSAAALGRVAAGRPRPVPLGHTVRGSFFRAIEETLARGGATAAQRHAAAVFLRQMAVSGALLYLTEQTNLNFLLFGPRVVFVALLGALHAAFPDDETMKRWWQRGFEATVATKSKVLGLVGPTTSVLLDTQFTGWRRFLLDAVRRNLLVGDIEIRRLLEEDYEVGGKHLSELVPWAYDVFNVKHPMTGATDVERALHQTGLLKPEDQKAAQGRR